MEQILVFIKTYGLEAVVIALLINILTGLVKMPIKKLASKLEDYTKVTRFVVFFPILIGFGLTVCYQQFIVQSFSFDEKFYSLWLTSSSLSLTIYAILEKMFPSKKKLLSQAEIKTSQSILDAIKSIVGKLLPSEDSDAVEEDAPLELIEESFNKEAPVAEKIVLRGKPSVNVES